MRFCFFLILYTIAWTIKSQETVKYGIDLRAYTGVHTEHVAPSTNKGYRSVATFTCGGQLDFLGKKDKFQAGGGVGYYYYRMARDMEKPINFKFTTIERVIIEQNVYYTTLWAGIRPKNVAWSGGLRLNMQIGEKPELIDKNNYLYAHGKHSIVYYGGVFTSLDFFVPNKQIAFFLNLTIAFNETPLFFNAGFNRTIFFNKQKKNSSS